MLELSQRVTETGKRGVEKAERDEIERRSRRLKLEGVSERARQGDGFYSISAGPSAGRWVS